jgi:hypothetical protein
VAREKERQSLFKLYIPHGSDETQLSKNIKLHAKALYIKILKQSIILSTT